MRSEASPRWRAVVGADASVGSGVQRKQEPWGLNHCPQRSGAEGETRGLSLWRAHVLQEQSLYSGKARSSAGGME